MISLDDVERLYQAVKALRDERRKAARMSEKAQNLPPGKAYRKAVVDLDWQAFHVGRLEHDAHAAAVDAGIADLREPEHYQPYSVKLTGFHEYEVVPVKPNALAARNGGR